MSQRLWSWRSARPSSVWRTILDLARLHRTDIEFYQASKYELQSQLDGARAADLV